MAACGNEKEEILEEIRKHNHIDVHMFKDVSDDPRDEDAKYVDKTMDKIPNDPNDPLAFFIQTFVQPNDILLAMFAKYVEQGKEELKVLEESK